MGLSKKGTASDPTFLEPRVSQLEAGKADVSLRDSVLSKTAASALYDDFDKADTILNGATSASGHVWSVSGPGQLIAKVKDGALISDGTNFYASLSDGSPVTYVQGAYSLHQQGSSTSGVADNMTLIMQRADDLNNMIHVILGLSGFNITKRLNGGTFDVIFPVSQSSKVPYTLREGAVHSVSMTLEGDTLTIIDAAGIEYTYVDADFVTIAPTFCTIQIGPQPSAQWLGKWHSISSGVKSADRRFLANGGASKSDIVPVKNDVDWLKGVGSYSLSEQSAVYRQRTAGVVISTNGWYTIATNVLYGGKFMAGKIRLNSKDGAGRVTVCEAHINSTFIDIYNVGILFGAGAITQIRRRGVSGDSFIDIYFPTATTNPVTFTADFEGFFTPVTPAIASETGVTAFGTKAIVIPAINEVAFDATVNGYYTLATQVGKSFGFALYGKATIEVSSSSGYAVFDIAFKNTTTLTASNVFKSAVTPVNDVRMTSDASNIHLDINLVSAATATATVKIRFDRYGIYSAVTAPAAGAAALTTTINAAI